MKLRTQFNLTYLLLLIITLIISSLIFRSFLMNTLVNEQQEELRARGSDWIHQVKRENHNQLKNTLKRLVTLPVKRGNAEAVLIDPQAKKILYSSISSDKLGVLLNDVSAKKEQTVEGLKTIAGEDYITVSLPFHDSSQTWVIVLATPLKGVQAIQTKIIMEFLIILLIGGAIAYGISFWFTRKLTSPLTRLNEELSKLKHRRFDQTKPVKATGEIGEVAQSVNELGSELKRYVDSQQHFFQNASHELKTPLMTIRGYAEGMHDGIFDETEHSGALETMIQESERMQRLLSEMLLLTKLESQDHIFQSEIISVKRVLQLAIERTKPLLIDKNIQLVTPHFDQIDDSWHIEADEDKLLQAIMNMITNAIRHARAEICLNCVREENGYVFRIEDDGPGLPEELIPYLFHRFVKGRHGENGLGLAISRAIIERMNGSVQAENKAEGGARFTIVLPGEC